MTQSSVPPAKSGEIETPNPLELFWEKNKRLVLAGAALLVVGSGIGYGLQYMDRQAVNATWSEFASSTNLDQGYSEDGSFVSFLNNEQMQQQFGGIGQMAGLYLNQTRNELITQLQNDVLEADAAELEGYVQDMKGKPSEPWMLWLSAIRLIQEEEWDRALERLNTLKSSYPKHLLVAESEYPPQFRKDVEKDEDEEETTSRRKKKQELEPEIKGSLVGNLIAQATAQKGFMTANSALYEAVNPPENAKVVVFELSNGDKIRIRLYADVAPVHAGNFLQKVREDYYDGMRIDEVHRPGTDSSMVRAVPEQFHLGLASAKEADRAAWTEERREDSPTQLDFEENTLSHFPGCVSAAAGKEGQSSGERFWINANDTYQFDGDRVIFGRVFEEDLGILEDICSMPLADEEMLRSGRGQLEEDLFIQVARVEGEENVPPEPKKEEGNENGENNDPESGNEDPEGGNK